MRLLAIFAAFALIGLVASGPAHPKRFRVTKDWYRDEFIKYTGEHDIVRIVVPLNALNFDQSDTSESGVTLFFVEADIQLDGSKQYKGLYVFRDGKAKKLLDNGIDIAASGDKSKKAFFGATDGLYVYNPKTNSADKYGPITDSIISIAKEKEGDVLYILTEDNVVYKVTDNGEKKVKIDEIEDAKQIAVDFSNNLYFYSDDKEPWVLPVGGDVKKIEGLPSLKGDVTLMQPPMAVEDGVPFIVNGVVYLLYPNGTSELGNIEFTKEGEPTAYAPDSVLVQYYAYNKKIYQFDMMDLVAKKAVDQFYDN